MGDSDREALLHQCIKLTTWREAAFVMVYSEEGFFACYLDDVIRARGNISDIRRKIPLDNFLSGQFMECHIGDLELRYSPPNRMLLWRSHDDEKIATKFSVRHRVRLKIQPPNNKTEDAYDRMIDPADIHKFRMMVDAEDMLGIGIERSPKLIRKVMRELSKTYHPDLFRTLRPDLRELVEMRMKEMNQAKDRLS